MNSTNSNNKDSDNNKIYSKNDILEMIEDAPDVDYVGEYIKNKLNSPKACPTERN